MYVTPPCSMVLASDGPLMGAKVGPSKGKSEDCTIEHEIGLLHCTWFGTLLPSKVSACL